ncbi:MAG: tyrosine-protein phosphatase, partial [Carnobacterium sp.]
MTEIPNFRDIGGKSVGDKDKLKKHVLFRSGSLSKLSEKDQLFLTDDCQLKTIVDFRSNQEKDSEPDVVLTGVNYVPINVLGSLTENASLESMMTTTSSAEEMMASIYKNLVTTKSAQKGYQLFLE